VLRAEYMPRDAPIMRAADLGLMAVLAFVGTFFGPGAAKALASEAFRSGGPDNQATDTIEALELYAVISSACVTVACALFLLLMFRGFGSGPYIPEDAWKRPVRAGSLLLAALASVLNALNARSALASGREDDSAEALAEAVGAVSVLTLSLAVLTFVALFVGFWAAMLHLAWVESSARKQAGKAAPCLLRAARRIGLRSDDPPAEMVRRAAVVRHALGGAASPSPLAVKQTVPVRRPAGDVPRHPSQLPVLSSAKLGTVPARRASGGLRSRHDSLSALTLSAREVAVKRTSAASKHKAGTVRKAGRVGSGPGT